MHPKDAAHAWVSSTTVTGEAGISSRNAALTVASTAAGLNAATLSHVHFKKPPAFDCNGSDDMEAENTPVGDT